MECFINNCANSEKNNKSDDSSTSSPNRVTFHNLPSNQEQRNAWLESLCIPTAQADRATYKQIVICSNHFKEEDFYINRLGIRRIKNGAVPEVNVQCSPEEAVDRVCKLCLRINTKMHNLKEDKLNKMYQYVVGIEPRTDSKDRFPMKICEDCKTQLQSAAAFKTKALNSDELLQVHLESNEQLNLTAILNLQQKCNNKDVNESNNDDTDATIKSETNHTFEEENETSEFDEVLVKNENIDDEPKTEIEEETTDNQEFKGLKVNWDNIILVKAPSANEKQMHITILGSTNDSKTTDNEVDGSSSKMDVDDDDDIINEGSFDMADENVIENDKLLVETKKKTKKVNIRTTRSRQIVKKNTEKKSQEKKKQVKKKKEKKIEVKKKNPYENRTSIPVDENVFVIQPLSKEYWVKEMLAQKKSDAYKRAKFKCTLCFKICATEDKLERHCLKHSEKAGPMKCDICFVRMKLGRDLRSHIKRQHAFQYTCKLCPLITRNRHVALGHMKYHAGNKFICSRCGFQFEKQTTLLNHLRLKHMSDCVCELCGHTFISDYGVGAHKRLRHRFEYENVKLKGPYCDVCDIKFLNSKAYDKHLRLSSKHIKSEDDPNRLSNDPKIKRRRLDRWATPVRRTRIRPREEVNAPLDNETVICEQCGIKSEGLRAYSRHFRQTHIGLIPAQCPTQSTPYMCEHCGKMFMSSTNLEGHMWVHTGQKRFQCDHCNKTFSMKANLAGHMKQHDSVRRSYACQICGKLFAFSHNLGRHIRVHTGERPYKCDACEKAFRTNGELKAHVDHVHLKIPRPKRIRRRTKKCDIPTTIEY